MPFESLLRPISSQVPQTESGTSPANKQYLQALHAWGGDNRHFTANKQYLQAAWGGDNRHFTANKQYLHAGW